MNVINMDTIYRIAKKIQTIIDNIIYFFEK